jgi:hypothetical protein
MAKNSKNTPDHEYSKVDGNVIVNFYDGDLPLTDRWESLSFTSNPQTGTMKGSGKFPRAHVATRYEPELSITMDADLGDYVCTRAGDRGVKSVTFIRQRPNDSPITTVYNKWKPSFPDMEVGDDAVAVEVTGNLLGWVPDTQKKIVITT